MVAIQYVIGWSLDCFLELRSAMIDVRPPPQEYEIAPGVVLSHLHRQQSQWSFVRDYIQPPPPSALGPIVPREGEAGEGWPPDSLGCLWFYQGCTRTVWDMNGDLIFHRVAQVAELNACAPDEPRLLDLSA
jgi:hypothetical protein